VAVAAVVAPVHLVAVPEREFLGAAVLLAVTRPFAQAGP